MPIPVPPTRPGRPPTHVAQSKEDATTRPSHHLSRLLPAAVAALATVAVVAVVAMIVAGAPPAFAAAGGSPSLTGVIDNLRNWLVGLLATVATLFLTLGGLRYLTAGGDPGQVEKAKTALKSAAVGYALAALAPLLVSILASLVGR